jgi:predicted Abi (CAAX) family protease
MLFFRAALLLMLFLGVACFAVYAVTGSLQYRRVGVRLVKWTVVAGLVFFAVLIVERLARSS